MNKVAISTLLSMLLGLGGMTAQASADTSAAIAPLVARGTGPVNNPEASKDMEDKKAGVEKQMPPHTKQGKHPGKKKHHGKKKYKKKQ